MVQKKDILILANLRKNSRAQLTKISKTTGIPVSTIFDKLKAYKKGIITRYATLLDFPKLGFNTLAVLVLRVKKEDREALNQFLLTSPSVNTAFKINNGYDFLIEVIFKTMMDFEGFQEALDDRFTIKAKQVYYIIDDLKREDFLTSKIHMKMVDEK